MNELIKMIDIKKYIIIAWKDKIIFFNILDLED
jgi:hypothetical protein